MLKDAHKSKLKIVHAFDISK